MGAFNIVLNYKVAFDYKLRNNILFNLKMTIYIFNNRVRFISEVELILDYIYIGLYIKEIVGFSIAIDIINRPKGKEQILFIEAAYILSFYTNLVYI